MYISEIKRIIKEELYIADNIENEENLFETGLLDSLTTLKFFCCLEDAFKIEIDLAEVEITDFETIEKINEYIIKAKK